MIIIYPTRLIFLLALLLTVCGQTYGMQKMEICFDNQLGTYYEYDSDVVLQSFMIKEMVNGCGNKDTVAQIFIDKVEKADFDNIYKIMKVAHDANSSEKDAYCHIKKIANISCATSIIERLSVMAQTASYFDVPIVLKQIIKLLAHKIDQQPLQGRNKIIEQVRLVANEQAIIDTIGSMMITASCKLDTVDECAYSSCGTYKLTKEGQIVTKNGARVVIDSVEGTQKKGDITSYDTLKELFITEYLFSPSGNYVIKKVGNFGAILMNLRNNNAQPIQFNNIIWNKKDTEGSSYLPFCFSEKYCQFSADEKNVLICMFWETKRLPVGMDHFDRIYGDVPVNVQFAIVDITTGKIKKTLHGKDNFNEVFFYANNECFVSYKPNRQIKSDNKIYEISFVHENDTQIDYPAVNSHVFNSSRSILALENTDKNIFIFDMNSNAKELHTKQYPFLVKYKFNPKKDNQLLCTSIEDNGNKWRLFCNIISGEDSKEVEIDFEKNNTTVKKVQYHYCKNGNYCLLDVMLDDGSKVSSLLDHKGPHTFFLLDFKTEKLTYVCNASNANAQRIKISSSGKHMFHSSYANAVNDNNGFCCNMVFCVDTRTGTTTTFPGRVDWEVHPTQDLLFLRYGKEGVFNIYDIVKKNILHCYEKSNFEFGKWLGLDGLQKYLSSDGKVLLIQFKNGSCKLVNTRTGEFIEKWGSSALVRFNEAGDAIVVTHNKQKTTMRWLHTFEESNVEVIDIWERIALLWDYKVLLGSGVAVTIALLFALHMKFSFVKT